jgi:hypothetical protein
LSGLLTLAIATGASFALAVNQIPGAELIASGFYLLISATVLALIGLISNSKGQSPNDETIVLRYDSNSIWYGRIVSVLCILLAASFVFSARLGWFPGQKPQRHDYTATHVPCSTPALATIPRPMISPTGIFQDPATEDSHLVERFKQWFAVSNLNAEATQILVVEQYPAFDDDYNTFSAVMLFRPSGVQFDNALVFLKRRMPAAGGGQVKYSLLDWRWGDKNEAILTQTELEQLRLPRTQSGKPYPVITIPNPREGESLLIFLRVSAPAGAKLESDASWFQFQLRRVQR